MGKECGIKKMGPVWFIPGGNRGNYPHCHSIYIEGPGILVDPSSDREALVQLRETSGVNEVWLSHWHEDHWMYLDLFDGVPVAMLARDAPPMSGIEEMLTAYGIRPEDREKWQPFFKEFSSPRAPDRLLIPDQTMDLGTTRVRILHSPGHTPGHMALLFETPGILFTGDYDLTRFGPWYGDRDSDIDQTIASITRLRQAAAEIWIASHGTGLFLEPPGRLWDDYLGVIRTREEKISALLDRPRTVDDLIREWIIYGKAREPRFFYEFGERAHIEKHLERWRAAGKVRMENGRYLYAG